MINGKFMIVVLAVTMCLNCVEADESEKGIEMEVGNKKKSEEKLGYDDYIEELKRMILTMPVKGAHISGFDGQLPNAPRKYRNGFHEGFDFYDGFCGVRIQEGTSVVAIADGEVIRADTGYIEVDQEKRERLLKEAHSLGCTPDSTLDILRGRQVWLDHGKGIVSRYCHLSAIPGFLKGKVKEGDVIGFIGGSGTKSKTPHLHFEIRLGKEFLGKGKTPEKIRKTMEELFGSS